MHLPGYAVEAELYRGRKRAVYRARRLADGTPVIVKALIEEFPSAADTANLRREYAILRSLEVPGIARAVALENQDGRPALVLEYAGETTLKELIVRRQVDLGFSLSIAQQLASVLASLHHAGIVHKDVNPNNIIVARDSGRATLTDFGIASRASSEAQRPGVPHLIEGTLAYMSPEQTGRMNRDLDYRSDLYSLGVTCFEMLTGRVPFESADPLEVIHGHVAQPPVPPVDLDPTIPHALSDLVLRLLGKAAEERYQSAEGVAADLEQCQRAWDASGAIPSFHWASRTCGPASSSRIACTGGKRRSSGCSRASSGRPWDAPNWCWSRGTPGSERHHWCRKSTDPSPGGGDTSSRANSISWSVTPRTPPWRKPSSR